MCSSLIFLFFFLQRKCTMTASNMDLVCFQFKHRTRNTIWTTFACQREADHSYFGTSIADTGIAQGHTARTIKPTRAITAHSVKVSRPFCLQNTKKKELKDSLIKASFTNGSDC